MTDDELVALVRAQAVARSLPGPAAPEDVEAVERAVGFTMPPLLRRLYVEVADGGFGPDGWQAVSLTDNDEYFSDAEDLVTLYQEWHDGSDGERRLVPLVDRGCAIWNLVDFGSPDGAVWEHDPNRGCPAHAAFARGQSLAEWIAVWPGPDQAPPPPTDCPDCRAAAI
ncbi:SMI1/KNR4 family protein [Streptomyces mesophilus]|uniref:SMI1/KNR4 family protein n=1 Tax=Streptomyces mesophilus TaxID=1775132 RepID=UPI00331D8B7D